MQADGGIRTGRDVVIAALLGADEFGFSTSALVAEGCLMMRKCHLNTCPTGIATQDPELRKRFIGKPEHVVQYFKFVAEDVRCHMARLGFRTIDDMIGRVDALQTRRAVEHWKASGLDLSALVAPVEAGPGVATHCCESQDHGLEKALDHRLIELSGPALEHGKPVRIEMPVRNVNRTVGAMLSGEIAKRHGHDGLAEDTIVIRMTGTAGQSFGAFLAHGVTLELEGDANDYVGKGLSGGRLAVRPPAGSRFRAEENIIVGNTVLYGAVAGECYFRGVAGERFAVRNSGAVAVVEGVGDHGCEYMTGGVVVVLGATGRNFAAGMSGGIAYALDEEHLFERRCNAAMVSLERVPDEEEVPPGIGDEQLFREMLRYDEWRLHRLIKRHHHYTGSERAGEILDAWEDYLPKFVKVMPTDYRRALEQRRPADAWRMTRTGESPRGG